MRQMMNDPVTNPAHKTWGEMTDAEKGQILLALLDGEALLVMIKGEWVEMSARDIDVHFPPSDWGDDDYIRASH